MISLRAALRNIHRDPEWWKKVIIGGSAMATMVGIPLGAGLTMESLDNCRKGFPTPLPPTVDLSTRYVLGLFTILIDFAFYIIPLFISGIAFLCMAVLVVVTSAGDLASSIFRIGSIALSSYLLFLFLIGVSPIGRLIMAEDGNPERAMSRAPIREALRAGVRGVYARARLISLLAYIPAIVAIVILALLIPVNIAGIWVAMLAAYLLFFCCLQYAHLIVVQIYADAERELIERGHAREA